MPAKSDAVPTLYIDAQRGMSRSIPSHLLPPGKWYYARNIMFREGEAFRSPIMTSEDMPDGTDGVDTSDITLLTPFYSNENDSLLMSFTGKTGYLLNFVTGGTNIKLGFDTAINEDVNNEFRWQGLVNRGKVYVTNPLAGVLQYDGTSPAILRHAITSGNAYTAKYIENFHDHLVIANLLYNSDSLILRVAYSDIGRFFDFQPSDVNEADFFDLQASNFNLASGLGITGLKRIGNLCAIYTADSIWLMRYVGFDNGVMEFEEYVQGVGAWLPYSVIGTAQYHVFIARDNIYRFDGVSVQPIGDEIRRWFYDNLTTDPVRRNRTWGFINVPKQTVTWFFITRDNITDDVDAGIVWNYAENHWTTIDGRGRTAVLGFPTVTHNWIDLLDASAATIDGLAGVFADIDSMGVSVTIDYDLFAVGSDLFRELNVGQFTNVPQLTLEIGETKPLLETGDFFFGDPDAVKEITGMNIHCLTRTMFPNPDLLSAKINVYAAVRDGLPSQLFGTTSVADLLQWNYIGFYQNSSPDGFSPPPPGSHQILDSLKTDPNYDVYSDDATKTRGIAMGRTLRGRVFRFRFEFEHCIDQAFKGFTIDLHADGSEN